MHRVCIYTRVKPTASRHAVTDGLAALAYGMAKTVRKCALHFEYKITLCILYICPEIGV